MTVDEYIAAADPDRREALRALREVIHDAAPQAREEIRHHSGSSIAGRAASGRELTLIALGGVRAIALLRSFSGVARRRGAHPWR